MLPFVGLYNDDNDPLRATLKQGAERDIPWYLHALMICRDCLRLLAPFSE